MESRCGGHELLQPATCIPRYAVRCTETAQAKISLRHSSLELFLDIFSIVRSSQYALYIYRYRYIKDTARGE